MKARRAIGAAAALTGPLFFAAALMLSFATPAVAGVGDPQVRTDHPWYPGELSCSTWERLFATQAQLYRRVTGRSVDTDEDKGLASWYWRNLNLAHGEDGACDLFAKGFAQSDWNREYWAGLFAHGFSLCGTTHAQYTAEINHLLGHCRGRAVGVSGHNSFEVYLTGGPYGQGQWALLDHDISTVIFDESGQRLLPIQEIAANLGQFRDPNFKPQRQRGWRVAGLHPGDAAVYDSFRSAEYLSGYAALPPMNHLRSGETLRRYLEPGLEDGKTYVFWGRNYGTGGIPGPERSRAWVNQPEKMFNAAGDTGHQDGRVRYANAVYTYKPDFKSGGYKEAAVEEGPAFVTLEFRTPYVIGCTPPNNEAWGVYEPGGKNGLVISGLPAEVNASVSVDRGRSWSNPAPGGATIDLTDAVKGTHQYWLRLSHEGGDPNRIVPALKKSPVTIRTVCQTNVATIPHLQDGKNRVTFMASGRSAISAGPNLAQAEAHVVDGAMNTPKVTLELKTPRGEKAARLYAAAWAASGNPPGPTKFQIEYSTDGGKSWKPVVKDWSIVRREPEPGDFWSQSFCWGDVDLAGPTGPVRVRFHNDGGKTYRKAEAHLAYEVAKPSRTKVTFAWKDGSGKTKTASHTYPAAAGKADASWVFDAGKGVRTAWVEYAAG